MMARGHLLSGAIAGVGLCAALASAPLPVRAGVLVMTTVSALGPDIDSPRATITRALGPVGWINHRLVARAGKAIFLATRTPADEESPGNGHRLISHTLAFAVLTGIVTAAGTGLLDELLLALSPAWGQPWGQVAGTIAAWWAAGIGDWWWAWGLAAGIGHAAGCVGDTLTVDGAPIWWPLIVEGRRWYPARSPLPFHADGLREHLLVVPALYVVLAASAVGVLGWWPPLWQLATTLAGGAR